MTLKLYAIGHLAPMVYNILNKNHSPTVQKKTAPKGCGLTFWNLTPYPTLSPISSALSKAIRWAIEIADIFLGWVLIMLQ